MKQARSWISAAFLGVTPSEWLMAKREDISSFTGNTQKTFSCKACKKVFARIPLTEVVRQTINNTWEQEEERIVQEHLQTCEGMK